MRTLCLVDDEPAVLTSLRNLIDWEEYGIEIAGAFTDPEEALRSFSDVSYDILITDVCMDRMTGLELIERAKQKSEHLKSIVISAWDTFSYVKESLRMGAVNYLLKPVDPGELEESIQVVLDRLSEEDPSPRNREHAMLAFRNTILERWIRNTISEDDLLERVEILEIDLHCDSYCVSLATIDDVPGSIESTSRLFAIIESNLPDAIHMHAFILQDDTIAMVSYNPDARTLRRYLDKAIGEAVRAGLRVAGSIGHIVSDPMMLHRSFEMAEILINIRHVGDAVVDAADYRACIQDPTLLKRLYEVRESVTQGEYSVARERFAGILSGNRGLGGARTLFLAAALLHFTRTALSTQRLPESVLERMRSVKARPGSSEELLDLYDACQNIFTNKVDALHPYIRKTIEWIYQESNQDISLKTAAHTLGVNPAYLGQLFRAQTGKHFNPYLTEVRLEKARNLIVRTDLKVSDIAARAGFSSPTYFNRIFKRVHGLPPNEYRHRVRTIEE